MAVSNLSLFSFVTALVLLVGCADAPGADTSDGAADLTSVSATTSGGESAQTTPPQAGEETSESTYTLPSWPRKPKQEKGKAYPWDEGPDDPAFAAFRANFYRVVKEKDVKQLLAMTSDSIHYSFGDNASKENFVRAYGLKSDPENSALWEELAEVLELGGAFYTYPDAPHRYFSAPYIHNLTNLQDPYTSGVIVGENVRLREGPALDAKIVGALSWDIYELDYEKKWVPDTINGVADGWKNVKTTKGEEGYVFGQFAREPVDYRVGFTEYEPGKWRMDFFIAGD